MICKAKDLVIQSQGQHLTFKANAKDKKIVIKDLRLRIPSLLPCHPVFVVVKVQVKVR